MKEKRMGYTKWLAVYVLAGDFLLSVAVLGLCYLSIVRNYMGSLPYLTALVGVFNGATGVIVTAIVKKHQAENTKDGIVYEMAMMGARRDA